MHIRGGIWIGGQRNSGGTPQALIRVYQAHSSDADLEDRFTELALRHARPTVTVSPPTPKEQISPGQSEQSNNTTGFEVNAQNTERSDETQAPPRTVHQAESYANIMDRIRKWGLRYDGEKDPLGFIERVEELADSYEISRNSIPRALPELLRDKALVWFRNNNRHWQQWDLFKKDFLKFFLSSRYFERLDDEIRQRVQRPGEQFKDYVLTLQGLMRHSEYTSEQKLNRIYRNSRREYQLYVKRSEFNSLRNW